MVWIIGLLLLGFLSKKSIWQKLGKGIGMSLLVILTNPFLSNLALKQLESPPKPIDQIPLVQTGVVLGGIVAFRDDTDQIQLNGNVERVEEAIELYHRSIVSRLIYSGGSGSVMNPEEKESVAMAAFITTRGVSPSDLLLEKDSRNTYENAIRTSEVLDSLGMKNQPILLITSAFHMKRALLCFEKQGIQAIPYPVDFKSDSWNWSFSWIIPSATALTTWELIIREVLGLLMYRMTGFI